MMGTHDDCIHRALADIDVFYAEQKRNGSPAAMTEALRDLTRASLTQLSHQLARGMSFDEIMTIQEMAFASSAATFIETVCRCVGANPNTVGYEFLENVRCSTAEILLASNLAAEPAVGHA